MKFHFDEDGNLFLSIIAEVDQPRSSAQNRILADVKKQGNTFPPLERHL